jgi:hypothetical protein
MELGATMMLRVLMTVAMLVSCSVLDMAARAQDSVDKHEAEYKSETDPVRRAKLLVKLGSLEIDEARTDIKAGDDDRALSVLDQYRDEVHATIDALTNTGVDAERHPSGFKELQIGVRESVRRVDDMVYSVSLDQRPAFRAVSADLSDMENSLMDALFPSAARKKKEKAK